MTWKEFIKKYSKVLAIVLPILSGGTFISFSDFGSKLVNKIRFFWNAEEKYDELVYLMQLVHEDVQAQNDKQEMNYTLLGDLTKDISEDVWEFGMEGGAVHTVDIREVKEVKTKWAFIKDWSTFYPVYDRRRDETFTIMLHDERQDYELLKR